MNNGSAILADVAAILKRVKVSDFSDAEWNQAVHVGMQEKDFKKKKSGSQQFYFGKVRDLLMTEDEVFIFHSDRLSAFDCAVGFVPCKGIILNLISSYWFQAIRKIIPTHFIEMTSAREMRVQRTVPFKVEVVVRGYLAGSMLRAYQQGERIFCGEKLPHDLKPYCQLSTPIVTPTSKAEVYVHDEPVSGEEIVASGVCTLSEWREIVRLAMQTFEFGQQHAKECGWILADTKYEFGKSSSGQILLIDELHTPDSSRFWIADTYDAHVRDQKTPQMLDKENVRRWLMDHGFQGSGECPHVPRSELFALSEMYLSVAQKLYSAAYE